MLLSSPSGWTDSSPFPSSFLSWQLAIFILTARSPCGNLHNYVKPYFPKLTLLPRNAYITVDNRRVKHTAGRSVCLMITPAKKNKKISLECAHRHLSVNWCFLRDEKMNWGNFQPLHMRECRVCGECKYSARRLMVTEERQDGCLFKSTVFVGCEAEKSSFHAADYGSSASNISQIPPLCQREPSASIAWFGLGQKTSWLCELLSLKTRMGEYLTSR